MEEDSLNTSRKTSRKRILLTISSFFIASFFVSLAFAGYFGSGVKDFFGKGQALISETFKDIVSSGENTELLAEIDLLGTQIPTSSRVLSPTEPPPPEITQKQEEKSLDESPKVPINVSSEKPKVSDQPKSPCSFEITQSPSREVIFNEIAWMGSPPTGGKTSSETASDEWLELKNNSSGTTDLSGWQILDSDGGIKIIFGAEETIGAESFYLLERTDDDSVPGVAAHKIYSGSISNSGEWLKLFNSRCEMVDEINSSSGWGFFGGDNITKQTLERNLTGLGWHTSEKVGGTPKSENSSPVPPPPPQTSENNPPPPPLPPPPPPPEPPTPSTSTTSHLMIAEVQITGGTGLANNDFIKIYNPGSEAQDISGWKLRKRTQSGTESSIRVFPDGSRIEAKGYFLWANSDEGFSASLGANVSSTQTIAANNSIALFKSDGTLVDALAWGTGHTNPFVENSAYSENPGGGQKLSRKSAEDSLKDTDNNAEDFELR